MGGGRAWSGRRQQVVRRCSSAGESRAAGDGGLSSFCIIEGPETIEDFVQMQSQEIQDNIKSHRKKIFLLMEKVFILQTNVYQLASSGSPFVSC
uniref:Uncharacterized protein n=1 Tax=Arundo donax TaxID=35708 RepID=A0A0A9DA41_ARUDO